MIGLWWGDLLTALREHCRGRPRRRRVLYSPPRCPRRRRGPGRRPAPPDFRQPAEWEASRGRVARVAEPRGPLGGRASRRPRGLHAVRGRDRRPGRIRRAARRAPERPRARRRRTGASRRRRSRASARVSSSSRSATSGCATPRPIFLVGPRTSAAAASFGFNGWGGKYVLEHDDAVSARVADGLRLPRVPLRLGPRGRLRRGGRRGHVPHDAPVPPEHEPQPGMSAQAIEAAAARRARASRRCSGWATAC